jgi:CMP-N-acetylneuraminic acid synthetase
MCGGIPLIAWTIKAALEAGCDPYVSTEDEEIADVAMSYGSKVVWRPLSLAADDATTESVLIHALDELGLNPWTLCLPPTSPLRTAATIRKVIDAKRPEEAHCIMTVTDYRGDLWRDNNGIMQRLDPNAPRRQQERQPLWEENSACYLTRSESLWMSRKITGYGNVIGIPISKMEALDINDEFDLMVANALLTAPARQLPVQPSPAP